MDDISPEKTIIEDDVVVSYGCYFACHGKGQVHTSIVIEQGAYLGMRCNVISGQDGIVIGENTIVGAGSLVNKSIPENTSVAGIPAKMIVNEK